MKQLEKPQLWTKDFINISFASFFVFVIFYMLTVTLPVYVADELQGGGQAIGLVITVFVLSAIVFRPFSGKWLDTFGPKKILIIGASIFLAGSILYLFVKSPFVLLIIRVIHGAGFGMATTATGAIAAAIIPAARRGEGMGYYATFMNLAMVIGPFAGLTIIGAASYTVLFAVCIACSLLALICGLMMELKEQQDRQTQQAAAGKKMKLSDFFERKTVPIGFVAFTLSFVYSSIISFISVYARELDLVQAASYFFVVYAAALLISRPFTGRWFDQFGENKVIYPCILFFGIGVWMLSQASSSFQLLLSGAFVGIGFGTLVSCFQTIAVESAPAGRKGTATATFFVFFDGGFAIGSFILGTAAAHSGYSYIYMIGTVIVLIAAVLYLILHGRKAVRRLNV